MANTIMVSCPECKKQIKVSAELEGKKIRCKGCGRVFPVTARAAARPGPDARSAKLKAKAPARPDADDEEEGSDPYGVTKLDDAPRCPHCANELESRDAVICLYCGYNTQTREMGRTNKTYETTGGEQFLWLLPGILAAVSIFLMIGFVVGWHVWGPELMVDKWEDILKKEDVQDSRTKAITDKDTPFIAYLFHPAIEVWLVVAALFGCYKAGRFAVKRLIQEPSPPEKVKR